MKLFISINGLKCGGAEKSLISFLNEIPEEYIKKNNLEIDLLVLCKKDYFFSDIPDWVNWLDTDTYVDGMFETINEYFKKGDRFNDVVKKMLVKLLLFFKKNNSESSVQRVWSFWKKIIPDQEKEYDLAISYVDGFSNYYVMDKVKANKKILWVHNEYAELNYNSEYDRKYFNAADAIVTISDSCVDSLKKTFPEVESKIWMIPNISSQKEIWNMADKFVPTEYTTNNTTKNILVSIGRLNHQKGFDMAIDAAKILADLIDFSWFILGIGELKEELEQKIKDNGLESKVHLIGNRENPYAYIKNADIFVQPSRYEGKSIVLDEAKILEKPIVVTNYDTVYDSITDNINGVIVEFAPDKLAEGIKMLLNDKDMQNRLSSNLKEEREKQEKDIYKYIRLMDSVR